MPPRARPSAPAAEADPRRVVQGAIQAQQYAPVYYLHGDDDYLKDQSLRELLEAATDPSTRDFNCEVRRGTELDAEALESLLATPPMLAERRAVVIRDVTALKKPARGQLDRYLTRPASDTLLLLVSPAGTKADATLLAAAVGLDFAPLSPERIRKWIPYQAKTVHGLEVTPDGAQLLQQAVGNDLPLLASEIDKCASYVSGLAASAPAIDAEVVSAVVGIRRGETVTDLLDAVAHRDGATASALVGFVLSQPKVNAVQVVMMLATQAFALAYGRARRDAGVPMPRLTSEYFAFLKATGGYPGRPWGEAASLWTKVTDRWSAELCARALDLLLEADLALKDTRVSDDEQILTSLVLAMSTPAVRRAA